MTTPEGVQVTSLTAAGARDTTPARDTRLTAVGGLLI